MNRLEINETMMKHIFVNLKRFDVPRSLGGICPSENPAQWMRNIIDTSIEAGLGRLDALRLVYLPPESLIVPAIEQLGKHPLQDRVGLSIGCQGVYREDIKKGANFGAFTSNRPAAAMQALGCAHAMIGHSEERKDKLSQIAQYDDLVNTDSDQAAKAAVVVERMLNQELLRALERGMDVLYCVGETQQQKGSGGADQYEPRVRQVLYDQLTVGLKGIESFKSIRNITLGYEPIWAIGPGKTPPDAAYIAFVSSCIKQICRQEFNWEATIVYGGGLKEANAAEIAAVHDISGGLVALTTFTQPIGFEVESRRGSSPRI